MSSIKLSCSSSAYTSIPLNIAIQKIAAIGYQGVEILAGHERLYRDADQKQLLKQLKNSLSENALSVSNIVITNRHLDSDINSSSFDENASLLQYNIWNNCHYAERIKYYLRFAHDLNCPSVTILPGYTISDHASGKTYQTGGMLSSLRDIVAFAHDLGVTVGIAYGPGMMLRTANDARSLLAGCNGLKIAFHVGRSHLACETPCRIASEFKPHIRHIAIADTGNGDRPYLIPGAGEIEWISFFRTLYRIGYCGFVTIDLSSYRDKSDYAAKRAYYYLANIVNTTERRYRAKSA